MGGTSPPLSGAARSWFQVPAGPDLAAAKEAISPLPIPTTPGPSSKACPEAAPSAHFASQQTGTSSVGKPSSLHSNGRPRAAGPAPSPAAPHTQHSSNNSNGLSNAAPAAAASRPVPSSRAPCSTAPTGPAVRGGLNGAANPGRLPRRPAQFRPSVASSRRASTPSAEPRQLIGRSPVPGAAAAAAPGSQPKPAGPQGSNAAQPQLRTRGARQAGPSATSTSPNAAAAGSDVQPSPAGVQQPEFAPDFAAPAPLDTTQPGNGEQGRGAPSLSSREAAPPPFAKGVQPVQARHFAGQGQQPVHVQQSAVQRQQPAHVRQSAVQRQQPAVSPGQPEPVQQQKAPQSSSDAQRSAKHQAALDEAQQQRNPNFPRQRQGTGLTATRPPWPAGPPGHFLNMRLASGR